MVGGEGHEGTAEDQENGDAEDEGFAVDAVDDVAGEESEGDDGKDLGEADEAEGDERVGACVEFPADGDGGHLHAQHAQGIADEVAAVVGDAQCGVGVVGLGGWRGIDL